MLLILRKPLGIAVCAWGLASCGASIDVGKVMKLSGEFSDLSDIQKKVILQAKPDGIYYKIHAKFDDRDAEINLRSACLDESRLKLESNKRAAVLFAGLKASTADEPRRLPVFGYVFDDTRGERECGLYRERVSFTPPILLQNLNDDIQVSLSYHFVQRTHVPFGEIANLVNGINAAFGGIPGVVTAPMISRAGQNLEREVSERLSSKVQDNFSVELRIGPGRENKTQFMVPLVYKDGNEPVKKAGSVMFTLVPMATLSNAQVDPQTGAPKFDQYPFDKFPNVSHPKQDDRKLRDDFNNFLNKIKTKLPDNKELWPSLVGVWCDDFARDLRSYYLNEYDNGYILWSALRQGLPKLFNHDPKYSELDCVLTLASAIRTAGLPLKTRDQLIAEAEAKKAADVAQQAEIAAMLVEQQATATAGAAEVGSAFTQAAIAAHAAGRANQAASLGAVPAARAAAEEAGNALGGLMRLIMQSPNTQIQKLAIDPRLQPRG